MNCMLANVKNEIIDLRSNDSPKYKGFKISVQPIAASATAVSPSISKPKQVENLNDSGVIPEP
jgi:hypothetical protein